MLQTIILCRHGEVVNPNKVFYGRSLDIPLSEVGKRQITTIAKQILKMGINIKNIHSSPLRRAIQTSEILESHLNVPVLHNSELVDVNIPALIGKPLTIRQELHAKGEDEYSGEWVKRGNESSSAIVARMLATFKEIEKQTNDQVPLIVSHGDPLAFLHYALENSQNDIPPIGEIIKQGYGFKKGSGVVLEFDKRGKIKSKAFLSPTV